MHTKWKYLFVCLFTFLFVGGAINMLLDTRYFDPVEAQKVFLSARSWGWKSEPEYKGVNESESENVHTESVPEARIIKPDGNDVEIRLWAPPRVTRSRVHRLSDIVKAMSEEICFEGCNISVARNQSEVEGADAIVFFMFTHGYYMKELPKRKSWDQIWIYNQHEPPPNYSPRGHLNGVFNWTMTYRRDSDIYQPYYWKFPLEKQLNKSYPIYMPNNVSLENWIHEKTDFATAVISRCGTKSKRGQIIVNMRASGIPIDVYGKCGKRNVCRNPLGCKNLWDDLSRRYKFYLAFENSLCSDYVTEKFWRSLELGMVPVVLGRASYLEIAPPRSFIDVRDFSTPEELSKYLKILANDPKEYAKYFEWRRHFSVQYNTDNFCEVCGKLKEQKRAVQEAVKIHEKDPSLPLTYSKVHRNLTWWWTSAPGKIGEPACLPPDKLGLSDFVI